MKATDFFRTFVILLGLTFCLDSEAQTNAARTGRFYRGTGSNTTYQSFVIPLDFQKGVALDNIDGNGTNLFPGLTPTPSTRYHYDATNPASSTNVALRIPYNNPIVAFGSRVGGSPLYFDKDYHFGVFGGVTAPFSTNAFYVNVLRQSDFSLVDYFPISIPSLANSNLWTSFVTNGYQQTVTAYGLTTTIRFDDPSSIWGVKYGAGCYHVTHTATQQATNYIYWITLAGYTDGSWLSTDVNGAGAWGRMYTLEFQTRSPWRALYLDQPQFNGSPMPSFYQGKSLAEIQTNAPVVTNTVSLTPTACTNLDASPELRRHPTLDQFVTDMRNDPISLANYVQNEIELTDALAYNDNGSVSDISINLGGVERGALGTFMEKQGSPTEQCALLVYLLRQAGIPATYVFPAENGLKMLDSQLSQLLRMQIHGAINYSSGANGQSYTTNSLIPVNYPWVAAYIGTNWVHLFPWLKDTEVIEGLNLYDYMPSNYKTSYQWVRDYLYGKTNIMGLSVDDTPQTLFPLFVKQSLETTAPGISLDDIGVQIRNRRHLYTRWGDFPRPPVVTNVSTAVESLGSSMITNVNPRLTNIFDTVSVTVSSVTNPATKLATGDLRLVDMHNRKLIIRHEKITGTSHRMILSLAPFRPDATGVSAFTNDTSLLKQQSLTNTLGSTDDALNIQFVFNRHRSLPTGFVAPGFYTNYLGLYETTSITNTRPLRKGDLAAICMNVGRVTPQMLRERAQELWNMENALEADPSATNSISPDVYQGAVASLMGMAYFEKVGRFDTVNQRLHKVQVASQLAFGLASIRAARTNNALPSGNIDLVQPSVDMFYKETAIVGNTTIHLDSGDDGFVPNDDYFHLFITDGSAQEHNIINQFFRQTDAVSTVKVLQLAQAKSATNGQPGILQLNYFNYQAEGNKNYPTGGTTKLKDQSPTIWARITNSFATYTSTNENYVQVFITPGPITNETKSFKGMGALILEPFGAVAAIAEKNGGYGANNPPGSLDLFNTLNLSLGVDADNNYSINLTPPSASNLTLAPDTYAGYNAGSVADFAFLDYYSYSDFQSLWTSSSADLLGLGSQGSMNLDFSQSILAANGDAGNLGWSSDPVGQALSAIADPVHAVTGEFFVNATDIVLPGPMSLTLGRNYSSHNLADNQFGYGWKFNFMPYLGVNTNANILYAAEPDGAVVAYEQTATNANLYLPEPSKNPQLNNNTASGMGSTANKLRNRIEKQVAGADTFYYLYPPTGGKRTFKVTTFSGTINRTRPYLTLWEDSRGNAFAFEYGTDSTQSDYAQVRRIQSSNGAFLGFLYDAYGHIVEAYTGDGRHLYYQYDQHGDLVSVTLPDQAVFGYEYEHKTQSVTNGSTVTLATYSTHLLVKENKPDGRTLKNEYDQHRRVTNQWATVGADLSLVRNGTFLYSNNFNLTNSFTNTITGYTLIKDAFDNTSRYDYTNSLITKITDPLNQTIVQDWYEASETNKTGYYLRSLESRTDKRGLVTQYEYDGEGNATNTVTTGDLTGDGTTQSATNTVAYNGNNLPTLITDTAGNQIQTVYHSPFEFLPEYIIKLSAGTPVSSNMMVYYNVTNVFVSGGVNYTNLALGLMQREICAVGTADAATNEWAHDGRGFATQRIRYTGTSDPAVTNTLVYNDRGEMVENVDGAGRMVRTEFDPMGRPSLREVFEAAQDVPASWEYTYYNENGEITWSDGPRYNPEDYVWRDYDGAGRLVTEIHWRSQAKADGTGVEAPAESELYAQSFQEFDAFGNLTRAVNPRGVITTNTWDAIGQLVSRKVLETNGSVLTSDGFAYEPGGKVSFHTNALNGITETQYTSTGQPKYRMNADGSTNAWRYLVDGRLHRETKRNGAYWETTYDDANRASTRVFYSAAGTPLATNSTVLDRRGNVFTRTDAGGNTFTNSFDGMDRLKWSAGPMIVFENPPDLPAPGGPPPPIQQTVTNFYDAAGLVQTSVNAVGEKTIAYFDALGRTTRAEIRSATDALVRETSTAYSADHHGMTVTNGSGSSAIVSTSYTDNDGHTVLSIGYPSANTWEFTRQVFDLAGNLTYQERDSLTNGTVTPWSGAIYAYDGLNRRTYSLDRDNAETLFNFNALGNLTNRVMPGGLRWQAQYNNAGQLLTSWNLAEDSSGTRTNSYTYYGAGSPFAGLRQTHTDGRGVVCTTDYDDFLRPTTNSYTGSLSEHNLTTVRQYEARGLLTEVSESFGNSTNGPSTSVSRSYDPYGQLAGETVNVDGFEHSTTSQQWDSAARRGWLAFFGFTYHFGWQADGKLSGVTAGWANSSYSYSSVGLLNSRTMNGLAVNVTSRDGVGRILARTSAINSETQLSETMAWTGDGLLSGHNLARTDDYTDYRSYDYTTLSRRLEAERIKLTDSTGWTNVFGYDGGEGGGAGVLTRVAEPQAGGAEWTAELDGFNRIERETNNVVRRPAQGRLNATPQYGTVSLALDGHALAVNAFSTSDSNWPTEWRTEMELRPGTRTLVATAQHSSRMFTTNTSVTFTNNAVDQTTVNHFAEGQLSYRVWVNSLGQTNRVQTFTWDGRSRLIATTEVDDQNNGYNWSAVYDALGRRLKTTTIIVTNGVALTNQPKIIGSYFDPSVEFLELGLNVSGKARWKVYGPDLNGGYGGMNGTGGFDGVVDDVGVVRPVVSDARGNVHGIFDTVELGMNWNDSRPTGYGAVPEHRPLSLADNGDLGSASAWRGRWPDRSGLYWLGARYYDPVAGRFISCDPYGHDADPSLYAFANGDPINGFDPDGRIVKGAFDYGYQGGAQGEILRALGGYLDNYNNSGSGGGWFTGFSGTLVNELAGATTPSTYVNGLQSYGHNVSSYYQDGGLLPATSYALTSWNVGSIYSGFANFDLHYDTAGQPIGDWYQRATVISGGVANTAGVSTLGLIGYGWMTAPAVPPVLSVAEGTMALSPYRVTTAGETFYHYGYAENAASFQGGLRSGGFVTSIGDLSGAEAQSGLALPHATPPNAVYTVTPQPGTWIRVNPVAESLFGQPGGLPEFQFPGGTAPGTVSPPTPVLPR